MDINGIKLHYLDHGTDGKPPLLCIHGLSGNAHNFDGLAPHLASRYHVMALDVRGRGESGWGPATEYTAPNYASDVAGFLDALGTSRVTLIGTSMGGVISILFAGGYPERVERLVLNDIGPDVDPAGIARIVGFLGEAPTEFADLREVAAYYRKTYPPAARLADAQLIELVKWSVKPAPGGRLVWKMDPQVRRPVRGGAAARPLDLWVPFARIEAPVLVVRGAESDVLARPTVPRMKTVIRTVESVEVAGLGHAPSLVEPEALAAIRKFLGVEAEA